MAGLSNSGNTLTKPIGPDGSTLLEITNRLERQIATLRSLETVQSLSTSGDTVIDVSLGEYVRLTLTGDVDKIVIANWQNPPLVTRLTIEVINPDGHAINLGFTQCSGPGLFELLSPDAGKTVFGRTF